MILPSASPWWRAPSRNASQVELPGAMPAHASDATLSFRALMGFTFVLLLAPQEWFPALAPLRLALLTAALAVLANFHDRLSRGLPLVTFSPAIKLVIALVAWALVTLPLSYWPGGSLAFLLEVFSKTVIVFVLLAQVIDNLAKLQGMIWGLALMSVPLALTTVSNFSSGIQIAEGERVAGYAAGLTGNPNDMALMLNLILPLCIALLLVARRADARILLIGIILLQIAAIIATFSRAGFLTLGVSCMSYAWLLRKRPQRVWIPVCMVMVLIALPMVPASYLERIHSISNIEMDDSGSAQTRLEDMKVALKIGGSNPIFGVGVGMSALAMNDARGATWTEIHNVYLQYLVELGLPGLVLFLLLYAKCLYATRAARWIVGAERRADALPYLSQGIQVSLIAFAFSALFHPVAYHFYFYFIAGLAIAAGRILHEYQKDAIL